MTLKQSKILIHLLEKAKTLPKGAGCYLMKDHHSKIIYVGKAKNLTSRVRSYFDNSAKSLKTQFLISHVKDFDFVMTESEAEALVLENNLIKEYTPKYNIRMRDDKSYPYLIVDMDEPFPRLKYLRRPQKKKGRLFFGPFPLGINISLISRILTKSFCLRDCSLAEFNRRKKPCLLYQMGQCSAPCVGYIDSEQYAVDLKNATDFFKSKSKANATIKLIEKKMLECSENEQFEKAGILRDHIEDLNRFVESYSKQSVELIQEKDLDVVGFYAGKEEIDISIYMIRNGVMLGHKNFHFIGSHHIEDLENEVILYLMQYYTQTSELLPGKIYLDLSRENLDIFSTALNQSLALEKLKKVVIKPAKGKYLSLVKTTTRHAEESQRVRFENQDSMYMALNKLQELLNLKERPRIIECYDIAIWQGRSPTASQIVYLEGRAEPKLYRYYHLETRPEGNNDFAMLKEVIGRRVKKGNLPDLFLIDGGKAQVSSVLKILKELEISIPVVGIAKAKTLTEKNYLKDNQKLEERLVIPNRSNSYSLNKSPSLLKLCVAMRDEAHRFSRKLHHKEEKNRIMTSWLDEIDGIGPKIKQKILSHPKFDIETLSVLNVQELMNLLGISHKIAQKINTYLNGLN